MAIEDMMLAIDAIRPIGLFLLGMVIYSIFVFKFYRFVAKKDILKLDLAKYNYMIHPVMHKMMHFFIWLVAYIIVMPLLVFFWFIVLAVLIAFLSKSNDVNHILLVAMALVGSVRVCSYYSEDLSKDLAKMLPFALLGIYLVDISFFSFEKSIALLETIPHEIYSMLTYLAFVILLEFALRVIDLMVPRAPAPPS